MWYRTVLSSEHQDGVTEENLNIPVSVSLVQILQAFKQNGWRGLIVGGAVRDALLGYVPKDIDIEVYGPDFNQLSSVLNEYGYVLGNATNSAESSSIIGKAFGVIKFRDKEGNDYDFSLPRRDSKTGEGHTGFDIQVDPNMSPFEAAKRRDFSFNALAYDPLNYKMYDYFGGRNDLENKILRATDEKTFGEDPLRVLRGMQFAARMGLTIEPKTAQIAKTLADDLKDLYKTSDNTNGISRERVAEEFMKLATKGKFPGSAIQYLIDTGWIKYFPQIEAIVDVPQEYEWHPEGPVHTHTAHVMDAAASIADRRGLTGDDRAVAIFAALGHDFAKAFTTEQKEKGGKMRWTAHGHEEAGGPVVQEFLKNIGVKNDIINRVVPLVKNHLNHIQYKDSNIGKRQVRILSHNLSPATIEELVDLIEADHSGRPPLPKKLPDQAQWLLDAAKADDVHNRKPAPVITGKHVVPYFQGKTGPHIGKAVQEAYKAYLKDHYSTLEEGKAWLENYVKPSAALLRGEHVLPYFNGRGGPEVGKILDDAWNAQLENKFADQESAQKWLSIYMKTNYQPIDSRPEN